MLADFEKLKKAEKFFDDEEEIKKELYDSLDSAVAELVSKSEEIPVAFSGGVDSSIVAYLTSKYSEPILFCAGFKNSHDVGLSQKSAKGLGLNPKIIYLDGLDLKKYLGKTVEILGTENKLIADLNVPLFIILEELKKRKYKNFLFGQGADTLFGGFAKYAYAENLDDDMFGDIKNIYSTNLQYNFKVCDYFGVKPLLPFLEKEVVELAIKISSDLKIKNNVQKYILREAFRKYLPKEMIEQKKKSFQYGSGIHKALRKI